MTDARRGVEAVWRIEGARIVASVAKMTGDLGLAEDVAQESLVEALGSWPKNGVPDNPGAWLTAVAKRRVIDAWRRRERRDDRYAEIARTLDEARDDAWEPIDDDIVRLVFTACHPVLSREAQVALTLRIVAGLSTEEIARMLLTTVPTVQARITRAKKTLAAARIPFETPEPAEWKARLSAVLGVVYLVFTEGYAATGGDRWVRPDLADEAIRLGRVVARLLPRDPEPLALVALMEFQRARFAARETPDGTPILLADQDRSRWDRGQILRAVVLLRQADAAAAARGVGRGPYALQAAIAQCHALAPNVESTDWPRIVVLYEALGRLAPNPIVDLNRAVAVSQASGPAEALALLDTIDTEALRGSHLLPSVRGELLARLGRTDEARAELRLAASLSRNAAQRTVLEAKAAALSVDDTTDTTPSISPAYDGRPR